MQILVAQVAIGKQKKHILWVPGEESLMFARAAQAKSPTRLLVALMTVSGGLTGCGAERPLPQRSLGGAEAMGSVPSSEMGSTPRQSPETPAPEKASSPASGDSTQPELQSDSPLSAEDLASQAGEHEALLSLVPTLENYRQIAKSQWDSVASKKLLLSQIVGANDRLCARREKQAQSCALLHPLISEPPIKTSGAKDLCAETGSAASPKGTDASNTIESSLWVVLKYPKSGPTRSFFLRANKGSLISNTFTSGAKTSLTWRSTNASPSTSPSTLRIADLSDLQIAPANGPGLPEWISGTSFEVGLRRPEWSSGARKETDTTLLSSAALLAWKTGASTAAVSLSELEAWNDDARCRVTETDLDQLAVSSSGFNATPVHPRDIVPEEAFSSVSKAQDALRSLTESIATSKASLKNLEFEIERQSDRGAALRTQLREARINACQAHLPVRNLEILFRGEHLKDSDWDRKSTEIEKKSEGTPEQIEVSLGENIRLINPSEESTPLFSPRGYLSSQGFESLRVKDITHIRIKKLGTGFRSTLNCWTIVGWSRWGLGKKCEFQNSETHRYFLGGLTIRIDGRDFYSAEKINLKLSGDTQTWQDDRIASNETYLNYMSESTCTGGP